MIDVGPMSLSVLFFSLSGPSFCMDGQVVHVDRHPSLSDFLVEDHVHHHLEGGGGVG